MTTTWDVITGDCLEVLPTLGMVDALICDPPYSPKVHQSVRTAARRRLPDVKAKVCRTRRTVDLGFEGLTPEVRLGIADWAAHHVRRWSLIFSDVEGVSGWIGDLTRSPLVKYMRTGCWIRRGGAPQFNGLGPASGFEAIVICHAKGRTKWNGGGHMALYDYPVVCNRKGQQGTRYHPTQKPLALMRELVRLYTDPGDLVVDPFCGVGTTVLACALEGRRCIGIERSPEWADIARERVACELAGTPYRRVLGSIAEMAESVKVVTGDKGTPGSRDG